MDAARTVRRLVGGLFIAAGLLIALSCGLCTAFFAAISIGDIVQNGTSTFVANAPFMAVGVVVTAVGIAMVVGGRVLLRDPPATPPPAP